ncbi:MAG TPA: DUF1343 domain-containing protein [Candidatus Baltobacteraceae bacterium]|nr:DUF1343 domain-containing protein [Candidatus Baltobacteraceae bacterium]
MQRRAFLASLAAAGAATSAPLRAGSLPTAKVRLGDEVFLSGTWEALRGLGVGVITNQTGVTSRLQSIVDAMHRNPGIALKAIYAPEHGFRGDRPAGSYVPSYTDPSTGLPVYSLYGPTRHPSAAMLRGIDALVFDIQDVGSRAYTFISTMAYAMQTAKQFDKEIWVLDRPNPVGDIVEGPVLEKPFESFIGLYPIAMRHGMTVGELAKLFNEHFGIGAKLTVVPMAGYRRDMIWPDTGLHWVQSSPNIPTWQTTFPYLCTGLIDNAGVNNGVGTTRPFFYAGGYEFNGDALANRLNARNLPGVYFRAASWSPIAGFWANKELRGVELEIFNPRAFLAVHASVEILCAVREIAPRAIEIKEPASLDRDWGTDTLRKGLLAGDSAAEITGKWNAGLNAFKALRVKYLIY